MGESCSAAYVDVITVYMTAAKAHNFLAGARNAQREGLWQAASVKRSLWTRVEKCVREVHTEQVTDLSV
jgi:hypothetical protein